MKKLLLMAGAMIIGSSSVWAIGVTAGTKIENNATLSYTAGGVEQNDVNTTEPDSFVVDMKVDMVLWTTDTDHDYVTPGQEDRNRSFEFTNESNADMNFTFTAYNLDNGEQADYNKTADNTDSDHDVKNLTLSCTYGSDVKESTATPPSVTFTNVKADDNISCIVTADIRTENEGAADGQAMVIELNATAVDGSGAKLQEDTDADVADRVQIVFADGESNDGLGKSGGGTGDVAGNGEEIARSGYMISTPDLKVTKISCVTEDPVNGTNYPKRIPGATIRYLFDIENNGTKAVEDVNLTDTFSDKLDLSLTPVSTEKTESQDDPCECPNSGGNARSDASVTSQTLLVQHIDVAAGSTIDADGNIQKDVKHTCVWVNTEIK